MLMLLRLPIDLARIAFYALCGLLDSLRGRKRLRAQFSVLINAPRAAVWRFCAADRVVFEGPPITEFVREALPESDGLFLTRVSVNGHEWARVVSRELERDEGKAVVIAQAVPHALSLPPELGNDCLMGMRLADTPQGTALTFFNELTVRAFRERITYPTGLRRRAELTKRHCEKEAGTQSRLAAFANHGIVMWLVALLSFWYLLGWQQALLLAAIVVLHEAGHVAAMRMVGIEVHGIYLVPFFGGVAVPKSSYRSEGRLAFVALMGPGFSLIPTLVLVAMYRATGDVRWFLDAAWFFALINFANLLPIYPLDGGQILNALIGSLSRRLALVTGWIAVLAGLALAVYLQSFLIGIPFLLVAVQRYLGGGRTLELERLSLAGGIAVVLGFVATCALYLAVMVYAYRAGAMEPEEEATARTAVVRQVDSASAR
jgi:Zn-dependent protease